ncbi:MAG TPA: serine/threonine-protein kinase, partial [Nannocystaceae bacterium]|nr:serine/threonine-protein kinase [Nannocystaceae bacterium]
MRDTDAESASPPAETPDGGELAVLPLRGGEHVGRYVILYRLGKGGMGVVYAAYDPQLDRKVAIKFMRPRGGNKGRAGQQAMLHEAQALARLSHPNVVAIHDVGLVGDRVFVAMDFVDGVTLRRWVAQGKSAREIVAAYVQAGEGLAAAHRAGIVHRDFKPDNALMSDAGPRREGAPAVGRVQVLDFGLARMHDPAGADASTGREGEAKAVRPRGTPMYMAPEQHLGEDAGTPCDQFAFCVALYEALWRRLPFPGDDNNAIGKAIVEGRKLDPPRGDVPTRVRRAILRGLETDPRARFPSMDALLAELRRKGGRKRRIAALAGGVAAIGVAAWAIGRSTGSGDDPCAKPEERIAEVWNDARAETVANALVATERAHARHTSEGLRTRVDRYASSWIASWTAACTATHERHEQSAELLDLRMACLDARREQLDALLRLLGQADGNIADHALEAADALPALEPCADATALRGREPLPTDATLRAQIEELRARLAHAGALEHAGKPDDALAIAELASRRADELGWAPLRAESALRLGMVLEMLGRWQASEAALRRAEVAAEAARDDGTLADARIALVMVSGDRLLRQREGELWAELARASLDRLGHDAAREAQLENNIALALEHTARPE